MPRRGTSIVRWLAPAWLTLLSAIAFDTVAAQDDIVRISNPAPVSEGGTFSFNVFIEDGSGTPGANGSFAVDVFFDQGTTAHPAGTPDLTTFSTTVLFNPGDTSQTATLEVADDALMEYDESFRVMIAFPTTPPANTIIGSPGTAEATILDDDRHHTMTVTPPPLPHPEGTQFATWNITFTPPLADSLTLRSFLEPSLGSAIQGPPGSGADIDPYDRTEVVVPGATNLQAVISVHDDLVVEGEEDFFLNFEVVSYNNPIMELHLPPSLPLQGRIEDDDAPTSYTLTLNVPSLVTEPAAGQADIGATLSISPEYPFAIPILLQLTSDTAQAGSDFQPFNQTITFPPDTLSLDLPIEVFADNIFEGDEAFNVLVKDQDTGETLTAVVTIDDEDQEPTVQFDGNVAALEGNADHIVPFSVSLSHMSSQPVDLILSALPDGPAGQQATIGTDVSCETTFQIQELTLTDQIDCTYVGDSDFEPNEFFKLTITSATGATIAVGGASAQGEIQNDDVSMPPATPTVSISDFTLTEGTGGPSEATLSVELMGTPPTSPGDMWVDWATEAGSAQENLDFQPVGGRLDFFDGALQQITVAVVADNLIEANETFSVSLIDHSPTVTLDKSVGTVTILDDDAATPQPTVHLADAQLAEGDDGQTVIELRALVAPEASTISFVSVRTVDGTATTADGDYVEHTGRLRFGPGDSEQKFQISIQGDTRLEDDEQFFVELFDPAGLALPAEPRATVTIRNDDPDPGGGDGGGDGGDPANPPRIDLSAAATVVESASFLPVTIDLRGRAGQTVRAEVRVEDLTARAGEDFQARVWNVEFPAGSENARTELRLQLIDDRIRERAERLRLRLQLTTTGAALLGQSEAIVTIVDNDNAVRLVADEVAERARIGDQIGLGVTALGADDRPVQGIMIDWSVARGAQLLGEESQRTDRNGHVSQEIRLADRPGEAVVTARMRGSELAVVFSIATEARLRDLFDDTRDPDEHSVGGTLDRFCLEPSDELAEICNYLLDLPDDDARRQAVRWITPRGLEAQGDAMLQGARTQVRNVGLRTQQLRAGEALGGSLDGLNFSQRRDSLAVGQLRNGLKKPSHQAMSEQALARSVDRSLASLRDAAGQGDSRSELGSPVHRGGSASADEAIILAEENESPWGWFVNGRLAVGEHEQTRTEPSYDVSTWGLTAGIDYKVRANGFIGVALGYLDSTADINSDRGELTATGYTASLYTAWQWQALWVDGALTYGQVDLESLRTLRLPRAFRGESTLTAHGDTQADLVSSNIGLGYDFQAGRLGLTGFARGLWSETSIDGFSERGVGPFALVIGQQDVESLLTEAGLEAALPIHRRFGVLNPTLRLAYVHEFEDDERLVGGAFLFDENRNDFGIRFENPDRDYFNLGLGLQLTLRGSRLVYVALDTDLARDDWSHYTLTFGFRSQF